MSNDKSYAQSWRERLTSLLRDTEAWLAEPEGGDNDTYLGRLSDMRRRRHYERLAAWLHDELRR